MQTSQPNQVKLNRTVLLETEGDPGFLLELNSNMGQI